MYSQPQIVLPEIFFRGKQGDAWVYLTDNSTTEIFYGGAAGGGKSFLGCIWHIDRRIRYPGTRGLIGRAQISILEQSTLKTFFDACTIRGYTMGVDYFYNANKHIIKWANGSETVLKDLFLYPKDPDFTSLGSTEYTDAFIDEGPEITLKAFDIVNSRLRYKLQQYGLVPKILVTCNPSPGWIKDNYVIDPNSNQPVKLKPYQKFVRALVSDNPNKDFVTLYSGQLAKMNSEYDRQRLLHGNWMVNRDTNNPFAYALNEKVHFDHTIMADFNKVIHLSVDFNLIPFACLLANIYRDTVGLHVHFIGELTIALGSIPEMGERIRNVLKNNLHSLKMTGDSMGRNRNITQRDNASNYEMLRRIIGLRQGQLILPNNPTHETSRNDFNYLLNAACDPMSGIFVKINPDLCPTFVNELRYTQCDDQGAIIKDDRSDIAQRADQLDNGRYIVNTFLKTEIERHQKQNFGKLRLFS